MQRIFLEISRILQMYRKNPQRLWDIGHRAFHFSKAAYQFLEQPSVRTPHRQEINEDLEVS